MDYDINFVKVLLTDEELQIPAIDELCMKFSEWIASSKESKTRAANRRAEMLYDELISFKLPQIKINERKPSPVQSVDTSVNSDLTSSSRPITRSLRSRCKTPLTTPCTPTHQKLRANMRQPASGTSNVPNSANQQHFTVSATKARQQLRADSAQKKREEENERNLRLMLDMQEKGVRAEAQKKQLLEERAANAKLRREQRLLQAAEKRAKKASEEAKLKQKQRQLRLNEQPKEPQKENTPPVKAAPPQKVKSTKHIADPKLFHQQEPQQTQPQIHQKLNETFKKPSEDVNNIDIVICDDSTAEQKEKAPISASWARAPHLRDALIAQFKKPNSEILKKQVLGTLIKVAKLPVELDQILGPGNATGSRHLVRTSSAVWSPPNASIKRTDSMVMTPNADNIKRN